MTEIMHSVQTRQMILLIRKQPALWNKDSAEYKDKIERSEAWHQVYRALLPNYDSLGKTQRYEFGLSVTKKWYNVRDAYVKYLKNFTPNKKPYLYSNILSFLDKAIKPNGKIPDIKVMNESEDDETRFGEDDDDRNDNISVNWGNDDVFVINEQTFEDPLNKKFKKEVNDIEENVNDSIVSVLQKLIEKEVDEDRAFFTSIIPTVKSLAEESKFEFRIQVMQILRKLKKKDEQDQQKQNLDSCVDDSN